MRAKLILLGITICFTLPAICQTYITNVTIIDVEKQKIIAGQTVVITGNYISEIAPAKQIKIPANAVSIDGKAKFLMPGLTDAHVHFFQSGGLYTRPDAIDLRKYMSYDKEISWSHNNMDDLLKRYLALGITTVVDVGATFNLLQQRDTFANKNYAPAIYMAGPLITTYEPDAFKKLKNDEPFNLVKNIEEARALVQKQLPYHPDLIKIWYIVTGKNIVDTARKFQPLVKAIIDEAHKNNLRVAVHATERITAQLAVESGCDYLVHDVEDELLSGDFITLLKKNNVTICPTLTVMDGYINTFAQRNRFSDYELAKSNPEQLGSLLGLKYLPDSNLTKSYKMITMRTAFFNHSDSIRKVNLKRMSDAGVTIASGTDAGNIGTLHATSYFGELKAMQQSGMSNWKIIQASSINGAKAIGKEKEFGSIAIGKKADLILLNGNPVDSLENLQKINLVINKGYVIMPDTLVKETPETLVQRQVNAYNQRNVDAFLEPYAEDIELYDFPNTPSGKGKEAIKKDYAKMFEMVPELHCEIKERIVQGNIVIDRESITGFGKVTIQSIAIYHIENNKIRKVYFIQ